MTYWSAGHDPYELDRFPATATEEEPPELDYPPPEEWPGDDRLNRHDRRGRYRVSE
jgi:hypothetical protein